MRIFIAVLALVLSACDRGAGSIPQQTITPLDPTFERISSKKKMNVGFISYPPSFIVDPNTRAFSGISHDILQSMSKSLGWELQFVEEVGWGTMIEALNSNRVDIIATAVWPTGSRATNADFVTPVFYSYVKAYVRSDDERFDGDLSKINAEDIRIAIIDGEMAATIADTDFPDALTVGLAQLSEVSQLLLDVSARKADVTFVEPAVAMEFVEKNPGSIKEIPNVRPVRLFPNSYMVKKGAVNLVSTLNVAVEEALNSGSISRVMDRYEKHSGSYGRVALATE